MIHPRPKPAIFFKITPVNPIGITIVDLGEMDDVQPASLARRHSSLPPTATETRTSHNAREGRYGSLPPKIVTIVSPSPSFEASETDGEGDNTTRVSCLILLSSTTTMLTASEIMDQDRGSTEPSSTGAGSSREGVHKGSRLCTPKVSCRAASGERTSDLKAQC